MFKYGVPDQGEITEYWQHVHSGYCCGFVGGADLSRLSRQLSDADAGDSRFVL